MTANKQEGHRHAHQETGINPKGQTNPTIQKSFATLRSLLQSEGPLDEEKFTEVLTDLYPFRNLVGFKESISALRTSFTCIRDKSTMQGRAFEKAYGYAGDFDIIDKIYTFHVSDDPKYRKWDEFFHQQPAPKAVRNRKRYFIDKLNQLQVDGVQTVLNLASGPCRDVLELFEQDGAPNYLFDCVELDQKAISYAQGLLGPHVDKITFINENIFRFQPTSRYDIIWSAGLFDYFDDRVFQRILSRLVASNPEAKIVIGNFSDANPTMPYMEIIGEWHLRHRSEAQLIDIAIKAGVNRSRISIESEPEGVNLFLNIN